jgi:hypothetical protein
VVIAKIHLGWKAENTYRNGSDLQDPLYLYQKKEVAIEKLAANFIAVDFLHGVNQLVSQCLEAVEDCFKMCGPFAALIHHHGWQERGAMPGAESKLPMRFTPLRY